LTVWGFDAIIKARVVGYIHTLRSISKMATSKRFSVVGVSTLEGKTKIRFANDVMRVKILAKNGHTDVDLVELPSEMTKAEAVQHLRSIGFGAGKPAVEAALAYTEKKNPSVKPQKATAVTAEAVSA
jgi:hypothetical protein